MHFLLHSMGFSSYEELSSHSLILDKTGCIPSWSRTPHSWRDRWGQQPRERRNHRILGAGDSIATMMMWGSTQAGLHVREGWVSRGEMEGEGAVGPSAPERRAGRVGGDPDPHSRGGAVIFKIFKTHWKCMLEDDYRSPRMFISYIILYITHVLLSKNRTRWCFIAKNKNVKSLVRVLLPLTIYCEDWRLTWRFVRICVPSAK